MLKYVFIYVMVLKIKWFRIEIQHKLDHLFRNTFVEIYSKYCTDMHKGFNINIRTDLHIANELQKNDRHYSVWQYHIAPVPLKPWISVFHFLLPGFANI